MQEIEALKNFCLSLKGTTFDFPFGDNDICFRVGGKIYAIADMTDVRVNLKADPDEAARLREAWPDQIRPGYHMNKKHWNTVELAAGLPHELIAQMIERSYRLVFDGLPKKIRETI